MAKLKILWIEDSARYELAELAGPVLANRGYLLTLAEDASTALLHLTHTVFDGVIVDIRLPPGSHVTWTTLYHKCGNDRIRAGLGLHLLHWLFDPQRAGRPELAGLPTPPDWIVPEKCAVFTADHPKTIENALLPVIVKTIQPKSSSGKDTVLLDLITLVVNHK